MSRRPQAPTHNPVELRGDYTHAGADYTVEQPWNDYTEEDHDIWRTLYARQSKLIERYAAPEFIAGTRTLGESAERIPRVEETNKILTAATGWRIVMVPGLIPEEHFFA